MNRGALIPLLGLTLAACTATDGAGPADGAPAARVSVVPNTRDPAPVASQPPEYPDAALRAFWRAMRAPRPVENSAMPPRHLDERRFPELLVERTEIVPGGPPPDGIPPIDAPTFVTTDAVGELDDDEAVLVLEHGTAVRIYPVRIMIWHEIVNDEIDGTPITVTYCPLCNSALAYERTLDGEVLDFGTSGYLYRSGMVMYDRQTESLWTHFDGRSVVGTLMGAQLEFVPVATLSWAQAREAHPEALVLQGSTDDPKPYGRNRYSGYDQLDEPLRGWFEVAIPEPIPPMSRVVGLRTADGQIAVPTVALSERRVVEGRLGELRFAMFWAPGTASPLQRDEVADGDDIGSTGVFDRMLDGRILDFAPSGDGFVDAQTGSRWNIVGEAVAGPLAGASLTRLQHLDTFWFAWVGHHPDTGLLHADGPPA